jgi:hypothetical protein
MENISGSQLAFKRQPKHFFKINSQIEKHQPKHFLKNTLFAILVLTKEIKMWIVMWVYPAKRIQCIKHTLTRQTRIVGMK